MRRSLLGPAAAGVAVVMALTVFPVEYTVDFIAESLFGSAAAVDDTIDSSINPSGLMIYSDEELWLMLL